MSLSLSLRFSLLGVAAILLSGCLLFFSLMFFHAQYQRTNEILLLADDIMVQMLQTRRAEKDFMLRDLDVDEYFQKKHFPNLDIYARNLGALRLSLRRFADALPDQQGNVQAISSHVESYATNFHHYVATLLKMGNSQTTTEHRLWALIHDCEYFLHGTNRPDLTAITYDLEELYRQYMTEKRVDVLPSLWERHGRLRQEGAMLPDGARLVEILDQFRSQLQEQLTLLDLAGRDKNSGYYGATRLAIHQVDPLMEEIKNWASNQEAAAYVKFLVFSFSAFAASILLGATLLWLFTRRLTHDLNHLTQAVRNLGEGMLDVRVQVPARRDEVHALATAFNNMMDRLHATTLSKEYVDRIFDTMAEAVIVTGLDGVVRRVNPATLRMLGLDQEGELIGKGLAELPGNSHLTELLTLAIQNGDVRHRETFCQGGMGEIVPTLASAALMGDGQRPDEGVVCLFQDIRQRREAEEKIRLYNQELEHLNADKDLFFSIIAHDLKNPMSVVLGMVELVLEDMEKQSPEEIRESLHMVQHAGQSVFKLLESLLAWSRLRSGRMQAHLDRVDLGGILEENLQLLTDAARQKEIRLVRLGMESVEAQVDWPMVTTVVRNLLSNALKFTPRHGEVRVTLAQDGAFAVVEVADSGVGMSQEVVDKLFRFGHTHSTQGTNQESGTGLGLILCQEMVALNQGRIEVQSHVGQGSTFRIWLPLAEDETALPPV